MFKYSSTKNSGAKSWVLQRITGIVLVVLMISHYFIMHINPEAGKSYEAVLGRMSYSWYRIFDLVFVTLGMYHGLNGIWGIFRDYEMKPWLKITIFSVLIVAGFAFTIWGYSIIFSIPWVKTFTLN